MELTDTQLNYFVNNRLKLPKGKRAEYLAQVDHLIERFSAAANGDKVIDIKKFLKTGSLRKGTVLRPRGDIRRRRRRGGLPERQRGFRIRPRKPP